MPLIYQENIVLIAIISLTCFMHEASRDCGDTAHIFLEMLVIKV